MYSDDEEVGFGGASGLYGRSPSEPRSREIRADARQEDRRDERRDGRRNDRRDDRRRSRSRSHRRNRSRSQEYTRDGKGNGKGKSKDKDRKGTKGRSQGQRTTGRELPTLNSIQRGSIVRIQDYGAFVRIGDGSQYKDGLLHVSRISATGRIDAPSDVVSEGDAVWVKVCDVNLDAQKYSVDMRFVRQKNGEDLDPNGTKADAGGKGAKGGGKGPEPIRIGAVQATTCSKCGSRGHMARECWGAGNNYSLLEDVPQDDQELGVERGSEAVPGVDPKIVKAALEAYMSKKALGMSGDDALKNKSNEQNKMEKKMEKLEKKKEKERKKQQKAEKKARKKEKKLKKKMKKKEKKESKAKKKKESTSSSSSENKKTKQKKSKTESDKVIEPGSIASALAGMSSHSSSSSSS